MSTQKLAPNIAYDNGNIALHGVRVAAPASAAVGDDMLVRKTEFHICLVCVRKIVEDLGDPSREQAILDFCKEYLAEHPIGECEVLSQSRVLRQGDRVSLIALCNIPGVEELFVALEQFLSTTLERQPLHVTLYTLGQDRGIEVSSFAQLKALSAAVLP